jgi:peptide/nickel transport system ATP-binding protein
LGIQEGECLALVGESGSGKTTLARSIAGLHKHVDGEMRFAGRALTPGLRRRDLAMIRGIQYIFQNPYASLNPRRTVGQSLAIALRLLPDAPGRRQSRGAIEAALDAVALDAGTLAAFPDELSGGQRQRAAIARALIVEPSVLICDEITSSLDVSVQAVIVELLLRLQRERKLTVMFVTHNLALVRAIADSVAVMDAGAVVDQGSADDLLSHPRALQTAQLIEDTPHVSAARMVEL